VGGNREEPGETDGESRWATTSVGTLGGLAYSLAPVSKTNDDDDNDDDDDDDAARKLSHSHCCLASVFGR
jgi:hypothetical protein